MTLCMCTLSYRYMYMCVCRLAKASNFYNRIATFVVDLRHCRPNKMSSVIINGHSTSLFYFLFRPLSAHQLISLQHIVPTIPFLSLSLSLSVSLSHTHTRQAKEHVLTEVRFTPTNFFANIHTHTRSCFSMVYTHAQYIHTQPYTVRHHYYSACIHNHCRLHDSSRC